MQCPTGYERCGKNHARRHIACKHEIGASAENGDLQHHAQRARETAIEGVDAGEPVRRPERLGKPASPGFGCIGDHAEGLETAKIAHQRLRQVRRVMEGTHRHAPAAGRGQLIGDGNGNEHDGAEACQHTDKWMNEIKRHQEERGKGDIKEVENRPRPGKGAQGGKVSKGLHVAKGGALRLERGQERFGAEFCIEACCNTVRILPAYDFKHA